MLDWNKPAEREEAFRNILTDAMADTTGLKAKLLDPKTAKNTLEGYGKKITLPQGMEVVFYRQEDLPLRLVMLIPVEPPPPHQPSYAPGFDSCFKCTWITYRAAASEMQQMLALFRATELKSL